MTDENEMNQNSVTLPDITMTFDLEAIAGLFFMANLGALSVARDNTKPGSLKFREVSVDYKSTFVEFKNSCSGQKLIDTLNRIGDEISRVTSTLITEDESDEEVDQPIE